MSFIPTTEQKKVDKDATPSQIGNIVPVTQDESYCADLDGRAMDFTKLLNETFIVAVSTGDRNKPKLLASTIHGPFDFYEMVEQVGCMYARDAHHAKVYTLVKEADKPVMFLDEGTIDYIEANWESIIVDGILESALVDNGDGIIDSGAITVSKEDE